MKFNKIKKKIYNNFCSQINYTLHGSNKKVLIMEMYGQLL